MKMEELGMGQRKMGKRELVGWGENGTNGECQQTEGVYICVSCYAFENLLQDTGHCERQQRPPARNSGGTTKKNRYD
ncbi:unnamed protein product [Caenorhabditis nigoni]